MPADVAIPIAGFKDVYDVGAVEKALQELSPNANEALRSLYEKMVRLGGQRFTVKPSALPEMERLFAELPIDASGAVWLATANDAARIPEPLLDRLNVYQIDAPDAAGSRAIALSIYAEIRNAHDWGRQFPESPGPGA